MICPNCKKPLPKSVPEKVKKEALILSAQGYSCRDIQTMLGGAISFSSVSRLVKKARK